MQCFSYANRSQSVLTTIKWVCLQCLAQQRGAWHSQNLVHVQLKSLTEIGSLSWNQKSHLEIRNHSLKSEIAVWNQKSQLKSEIAVWNLKSLVEIRNHERNLRIFRNHFSILSVHYPLLFAPPYCLALPSIPRPKIGFKFPVFSSCFGSLFSLLNIRSYC